MTPIVHIAAFYHFQAVEPSRLDEYAAALEKHGKTLGLKGLAIFAGEGLNGTVSGLSREVVLEWLTFASELLGFPPFLPQWSESDAWPFRKFKIRPRSEIVTLGKPEVQPLKPQSETHLSPDQWNEMMKDPDAVVLDTRNWYETRIGTFKNAIDPKLDEFHEFSDYLPKSGIDKDKKVMIFCTGGIRCEKAIVEMKNQGFKNVYQLDGGILNYLAKHPREEFEGECFVFDNRVAVDQDLKPSLAYRLCPHCGQPADQPITCVRCDSSAQICVTCIEDANNHTCSKNCAHHYRLAPGKKGRGQGVNYRFRQTQRRVRSV